MTKIGFLFIDQSYSVYHAISAAIALSKNQTNAITIFCTARNRHLIDELLNTNNNSTIKVVTIRPYWFFTIPHYLEIKLQFRTVLFYKYQKILSTFDIICCTMYEDLNVKKYFQNSNRTKFIFFNHGAVNRSYSFDSKIKKFDLFTMSGNYEKVLRNQLKQLKPNNHVVSGYLKYELLKNKQKQSFFENNKPIIIYNPHWDKRFSSFPEFGFKILDFFSNTDKYNLIFTPHSVLMVRNKMYYLQLLKYKNKENILIDLGSEACNDLTYTRAADLYLGDASSQAWEFTLIKTRPCLFIDINKLRDNKEEVFLSWDLGKIIEGTSNLEEELDEAFKLFNSTYKLIQQDKIKEMFHQSSKKPSELVVEAIENLQNEKLSNNHE